MVIKDLTQNKIVSNHAKLACSFRDRLLGLLDPNNPRSLVFYTHFGIHTFFLKKPIDVLLLDNQRRIVKMRSSLAPFRLFLYLPRYFIVIELPQNTIRKCGLCLNDKIFIG
jgi:uncharacterized membrane protein (UPF0127 family)